MNKQGAYLPLPLPLFFFFSSAWICSANTNHSCSLADSLSLPPSISSHFLAWHRWNPCCAAVQLTMATTPCMPASGPHHHTDSPCLSPHPFFVLWCGRRDARQLHVCVCVCAESPLCIQCMGAHICVLIFLKANGCPSPSIILPLSPPYHVKERENKGEGRKQSSHAERSRRAGEQ